MATELNIINRGVVSTDWDSSQGKITIQLISGITESNTSKAGALNALPTPFARMYVFNNAITEVMSQGLNASEASKQLVSDCLDLFELLFNIDYHTNRKEQIIIKTWKKGQDIQELQKNTKYIGKSINDFLDDEAFNSWNEFHLIIYKKDGTEYVLGGTSPFTYFFTPPGLDKKNDINGSQVFIQESYQTNIKITNPDNIYYFKHTNLIEDRSPEFQKYMYEQFNGLNTNTASGFRDYIMQNKNNVNNNLELQLSNVIHGANTKLIVGTLEIKKNISAANFNPLSDMLIRFNYPFDRLNFNNPVFNGNGLEEYGFLLPIKPDILSKFDLSNISHSLSLEGTGHYKYTLQIGNAKPYEKIYTKTGIGKSGKIFDIYDDLKVNINIGIFPFVKSNQDIYNNYYQIGVFLRDINTDSQLNNSDIQCEFYKKEGNSYSCIPHNGETFGVKYSERNNVKDDQLGVNFFEIQKTTFDIISLNINSQGQIYSGLVIPKFKLINSGNKTYRFAVDFGTTNTHVAYTLTHGEDLVPNSFDITESDRQMILLNAPSTDPGLSITDKIEKCNFSEIRPIIKTHFVPSVIGESNNAKVYFPIRSALLEKENIDVRPNLFEHSNINFAYEKISPGIGQQSITNIKWDSNNSDHIKVFLKELLHLIRVKVLSGGGDISKTQITWFSPLSFTSSQKKAFEDIWKDLIKEILSIDENQLINVTESEAPFYYYAKSGDIMDISRVAIIDIGGGSVDYVLFENTIPKLATSAHFGCNVLWGNGHSDFNNDRNNLIYTHCKDDIINKLKQTEIRELNDNFIKSSFANTADIINFWIANSDKTEIRKLLNDKRFIPMFLYHFTATIYHLVQAMKSKNLELPAAVVFSGNGSRYLDFFLSKDMIKDYVNFIFSSSFVSQVDIQVILPSERKEATAKGGLYYNSNGQNRATGMLYLGTGLDDINLGEIEISKLKIEKAQNKLLERVEKNVLGFIDLFEKFIREKKIVREFNLEITADEITTYLRNTVHDAITTGYLKLIENSTNTDTVTNSLFFLPLIQQLFLLPNTEEIKKLKYKRSYYFKLPSDLRNGKLKDVKSLDTFFELRQKNANSAELHLIIEPIIMQNAMLNFTDHLMPFCDYDEYPSSICQSYEQLSIGSASLDNDVWVINEKIKVKFN